MGFPNLPGIPPLALPNSAFTPAGLTTLAAPLVSNLLDRLKPSWGIYPSTTTSYDEAHKAIKPDAFLSIDYNNESNVPMFPIEQGAFGSYNKVATPYTATVRIAKGGKVGILGSDADLKGFLANLETIQGDTNLYSIVTPDATYLNANLRGFTYKREMNNGAAMILATLNFVQIMTAQKVTSTATATSQPPDAVNCSSPSAVAIVNNGVVAPVQYLGSSASITSQIIGGA
jgi:hypothetical protein